MREKNILNLVNKKRAVLSSILLGLVGLLIVSGITPPLNLVKAHDDDAHPSGSIQDISRGTGNILVAKIRSPLEHRVATVKVAAVDERDDCDEDAIASDATDIASGVNVSRRTTQPMTIDADTTDNQSTLDFSDKYACFEAVYRDNRDTSEIALLYDPVYLVSDTRIDLTPPKLKNKQKVDISGKYDYTDIGDRFSFSIEFDEEVEIVVRTTARYSDRSFMPSIHIENKVEPGTLRKNLAYVLELDVDLSFPTTLSANQVLARGQTLTFSTYRFDISNFFHSLERSASMNYIGGSNFMIRDKFGNSIDLSNDLDDSSAGVQNILTEAIEINDAVILNPTPETSISYEDDKTLIVKTIPGKLDIFDAFESPPVVWRAYMTEMDPGNDTCYEFMEKNPNDITSVKVIDNQKIDLSKANIGSRYCFVGTLVERINHRGEAITSWQGSGNEGDSENMISSAWIEYVEDSASPTMTLKVSGSTLMITAEDTAGVKSVDWKFALHKDDQCSVREDYNNKNNDAEVSITATSAEHGRWICIKATDNRGNERSQIAQLNYVTPTTPPVTTPTDGDDREVTQPADIDDAPSNEEEETTTEVVVPNSQVESVDSNPSETAIQPTNSQASDLGTTVTVSYDAEENQFLVFGNSSDGSDLSNFEYIPHNNADIPCNQGVFENATPIQADSSGVINASEIVNGICVRVTDPATGKISYQGTNIIIDETDAVASSTNNEDKEAKPTDDDNDMTGVIMTVIIIAVIIGIIAVSSNRRKKNKI